MKQWEERGVHGEASIVTVSKLEQRLWQVFHDAGIECGTISE